MKGAQDFLALFEKNKEKNMKSLSTESKKQH